jgi:CRISPR-associated exonuclease Cas4
MLFIAAGIVLIFGLVTWWLAGRRQHASGLPAGRVIYTDTQSWKPVPQALYDAEAGLAGRPDYLVQRGGQVIPVEVKSRPVGSSPYDSHIYQLAAYCYLVEREYGKRPAYGILHYANRSYAIDYTQGLEAALLELLQQMRQHSPQRAPVRSHQTAARCQGCGFKEICDQKLD